ncbi:MAG: glycosyltransferase family 2 protein [Dissulfurimicrobium sp.]|uniref:glycosyltransferase family 2 protein n=1 Tax=Dissulfurimicrobium TaxID=1769732 RepID=UPI001EDB813A|nr:glycosyltransferase family A protein [Dissulfurimicrobium hydrothermale]UKL13289.1 glycosyltransferase family 2 protein [Dissulfurimicrobium hydrothermale]
MKISCIIPVRDRKDLVLRAIESVVCQTKAVSEVIVVDDGSIDGTPSAVKKRFPQVKVIKTGGIGPGLARNMGVAAAAGGLLMFLDSDDQWLPNHVSALMSAIAKGLNVAYGITKNIDMISRPEREFFIPERGRAIEGDVFRELVRWCFLVPSSVCVTREAFEKAGGFEGGVLGEDWVFFLRLSVLFPFGFVSEIITIRTLHSGCLCNTNGVADNILNLIGKIEKTVMASGLAGQEEILRLKGMHEFAAKEAWKWKSVQDWYVGMKAQGLIEP